MGIFSGRHFPRDIILWAVRWYCRYGVSYRDLEEMMTERGVPVDHTTIYRWVQKYAPELDKHTRWYRQVPDWQARSWRVDETYIRVGGTWCYLYRAVTGGARPWTFISLRSAMSRRPSVSWPRPCDRIRQPGPRGSSTPTRHQLWPRQYPS